VKSVKSLLPPIEGRQAQLGERVGGGAPFALFGQRASVAGVGLAECFSSRHRVGWDISVGLF